MPLWQDRGVPDPVALAGRRILRVTGSWHHFPASEASVPHLWLHSVCDELVVMTDQAPGTNETEFLTEAK
jgi:hypothetical protein